MSTQNTDDSVGLSPEQLSEAIGRLSSPDSIESPFGRLEFFDGVPTATTTATVYDALDLMRGIEVFLNAVPGASLVAMRRGLRMAGVTSARIIGITEPRANSGSLFLTPNTETTYGTTFLDLKAWGPTVIEAPPQSLCVLDDFWFRYVADMGIAGPDGGRGGKYLFLPPGYDGEVPEGYYVYRCPTFSNWAVFRALGGVPAMKQTRVYPLAEAGSAPDNVFLNLADAVFNTVHGNDFSFFEEVAELLGEEPVEALDAERAGTLAAIGLVSGQPFTPDGRLRAILTRAAEIGAGMARTVAYTPRDPAAKLYGSWTNAFVGGSHEFLRDGARLLDARTQFHYLATVITPAMAHAQVGAGSAYAYTVHDSNGDLLDGARTYRLHVDPNPPAKNFWAVDVYDTQTRSLIQVPSTIWPALASNSGNLQANEDGSYDLYFGPTVDRHVVCPRNRHWHADDPTNACRHDERERSGINGTVHRFEVRAGCRPPLLTVTRRAISRPMMRGFRKRIDHRNRIALGRKYAAVMIDDDQVMVLAGRCEQGYTWEVEAGGPDENFLTMKSVFHDGRRLHAGGMAGPKLYPGSVINEYRGRKDALPYVIVARTAPQVDRVVVTTDWGTEIELPLSDIINQFGLRFAAAVLPDGHGPGSIRAEVHGLTLQTKQQAMPRRRPPGGSGWISADQN